MAISARGVYIPSNFLIDEFCKKYSLPIPKVVKIVSFLTFSPFSNKRERYIRLNSTILKNKFGNDYNKIIQALINEGVFLHTDAYLPGLKSNQYCLADYYYYCPELKYHELPLISNPGIRKIWRQKKIELYAKDLSLFKHERIGALPDSVFSDRYKHLINWFLDDRLVLDKQAAYDIIENSKSTDFSEEKVIYYRAVVDNFCRKNFSLKSDINFRFYTNLVSLPKKLRACLRFDGEELAGTDISNTHPLLLGNLCNSDFLLKLKKDKNILVEDVKLADFIKHLDTKPQDLVDYRELVQSGKFYEAFEKFDRSLNRDFVKKRMLSIINDDGINWSEDTLMLRKALMVLFPTIFDLLDLLKSVDYHYVSSTLMSMEAQNLVIMFPNEFYYEEKNRGIPMFTIHDCFLTTKSNIDYLDENLKKYWLTKLGIKINTKRQ